jgi:hypothetical protein
LSGIALINFLVNPFRLYPCRLVAPAAVDDHTTKLELLRCRRPQLLVLGSSRVLKLEPAYLERRTGLRAFNLGVASGQAEDSLCLLRYATEGLRLPVRWVVLGVDVDSFTPTAPVNPQLRKNPCLRAFLPPELRPGWTAPIGDLLEALTLDQLTMSIRALWPRSGRRLGRFDADGLLHNAAEKRPLDLSLDMRPYMRRFGNYSYLSPARLGYLDEIARLCRRRRIRLSVFLTTVHAQYARSVAATYWPRYRELVPLMERKAPKEGFTFTDCSQVEKYGGDPNDFYDCSHVKCGNSRRIIDHVIQ